MEGIVAKTNERVKEKTMIATADMGSLKNMGYCRGPNGCEIKPFEFHNNREGFYKFWAIINHFKNSYKVEQIIVGIESTGIYGLPFMHFLRGKTVKLVQVNPKHTKRLKEVVDNSPNKTDKKDPKVIADIIELGRYLSVVIPEGVEAELRSLIHARERALKQRGELNNQLHALVFSIFPEFLQIMKDVKSKSARYLLEQKPRPEDIIAYGKENLIKRLKKISRGKLGKERAEMLYEGAMKSAGIKEGQESIVFEIREIVGEINGKEDFISELESKMSLMLKDVPYSRFLLSLKGIGEVTVAGLIGELSDFRQFKTAREILKFAGLNIFEISSGKHQGNRRISKIGRSLIRKLLFFAAMNTVRKGGIMEEKYRRYQERGMIKIKALIAIARKLLCIMFALVRDNSEYRINKDYTNLKKAA